MRSTFLRTTLGGAAAGLVAFLVSLLEYGASSSSEVAERAALAHYKLLILGANLKLALVLVLVGAFWGAVAGAGLGALAALRRREARTLTCAGAGALAFGLALLHGFCTELVAAPESVVVLWPYDASRLDPLYDRLRPWMLTAGTALLLACVGALVLTAALIRAPRAIRKVVALLPRVRRPALAPMAGLVVLVPVPFILGTARADHATARPNVLVLMSDTLRQDRTECARDGEPVMPSVQALAARGTTFRSCFVPIARTTESLATLMTGAWPQTHHVRSSFITPRRLPVPTIAERFAEAGYDTVGLGDWSGTDFTRLAMGFSRTHVPPETWSLKTFVKRGGRLTDLLVLSLLQRRICELVAPEIAFYPGVDAQDTVRRQVLDELDRVAESSRPFYMQVFVGNTHAPFTPKGIYHRRFMDAGYRGPNRYGLWARTIDDALRLSSESMRARDLAQLESVYDAAARTFDDDVAAALARVEALGLSRKTIVVVLSDHGTAFYERGSFGQGNEIVSDVSNRIPFVVFDPTRHHAVHVVDHVVREVDVMPTILRLAGLPVPGSCEGVSLLRYLDDPKLDMELQAYGETGFWIGKQSWQEEELDFGFPRLDECVEIPDWEDGIFEIPERWIRLMIRAQHRMIRTDRWKLVYVPTRTGKRIKLYDVAAGDKGGDVASEHPDVVAALLPRLGPFLSREPDVWNDPLPPPHVTRANTAFK